MAITQYYDLDLVPNGAPVVVNCSQYDEASRTFMFTMYEDGQLANIPSGSHITIRGFKPDKTAFSYAATRVSATQISAKLHEQMAIVAGNVTCELRIVQNGETLGTANFILYVERSPYGDDVAISETQMSEFETAVEAGQKAEEAIELVTPLVPENDGQVGWVLSKTATGTEWVQMTSGGTVKSVNLQDPDGAGNVDVDAEHIDYDNSTSGMTATTVQGAIDEHDEDIDLLKQLGTALSTTATPTSKAVPSGTVTNLVSLQLSPGKWLVLGYAQFAAGTNGYRQIALTSDGTTTMASIGSGLLAIAPAPSGGTIGQCVKFYVVDTTTTVYLNVRHNQGSNLNCQGRILATQIGNI